MSRRLHPPLNFGGIASLVQDDEGNCGWMARIISDLAPPAGISQGLGVAIKLNAPPHTESTPFAPFDMRLRVHGMQQGARTRATPIPLRRRVRWMPRNGVRFLGIFGNISCNIILKFCNFTIGVGRDSLGTSIWKYNKKPLGLSRGPRVASSLNEIRFEKIRYSRENRGEVGFFNSIQISCESCVAIVVETSETFVIESREMKLFNLIFV